MSNLSNVDGLLAQVASENSQAPVQAIPQVSSIAPIDAPIATKPPESLASEQPIVTETSDNSAITPPDSAITPPETDNKVAIPEESPIDEYGNPIEKPKMYTEEELQQRIRERLARGRYAEAPPPQQVQQAAKDFTPDPNSDESWETQLEAFVEKTIDKRQAKLSEQQWKQQEAARQAEFEEKFTTGMSKYQDFSQVVAGKDITNEIMLAARALDNPAAFIYGASKLHPQELTRIAQIKDPYAQAAEVGRLHERMVKAKNTASKAGRPLEVTKGDMPAVKNTDRPGIDVLIRQHEQQKFRRK